MKSQHVAPHVRIVAIALLGCLASPVSSWAHVPGLECDYTDNGICDAADYVVWRKTDGQFGEFLAADGNLDLRIDSLDYEIWRTDFGRSSGNGAAYLHPSSEGILMPEPSTVMLWTLAIAKLASARRGRTRSRSKTNASFRLLHKPLTTVNS
jgi:hypothetical protein